MSVYSDRISSLNPKVWYRLDETSGTPANSGSLSTTATFNSLTLNQNTDVDGKAASFDGTNSYINISNWSANSLFDDKSFTIETWFKLSTQDSSDRPLFQFGSFAINFMRLSSLGTTNANSGKLYLNIIGMGEATSGDRDNYSTSTYFDSKWHHTVVTVTPTSLKWYIDGQLITTKTLTSSTLNIDSLSASPNTYRLIGAQRSNVSGNLGTTKYKGLLDEFALYDFALSAQEVLDNYNAGVSINYAAPVMTASAQMPKVLAVHDILYNLALQRNAAYIYKFNSTLSDVYCATSGHTFTPTNSGYSYKPGETPSITGGSWYPTTSTPSLQFTESTTPIFDNMKGMTLEFVFYLDSQVTSNNYKAIFLKQFNGEFYAVALNQSGTGNVLAVQLNNTDFYTFNSDVMQPGQWHHVVFEWGAKDDYMTAYINGNKSQSTSTYTTSQNHFNDNNNISLGSENVWIDFIAIYAKDYNANSYLTDDDVTIHKVSMEKGIIDMYNPHEFPDVVTASALMVNPTINISYNPQQSVATASAEMVNPYAILITSQADVMIASALFALPQGLGTVTYQASAVTANATMVHPSVSAIKNVNYGSGSLTANAQFETVFWSHDSGLNVSNLLAEAEMLEAVADIAGVVKANPMIASDGFLRMPSLILDKNALIYAEVTRAYMSLSTPPAYIQLSDDPWYVRLLEGHSDRKTEPKQAFIAAGTESTEIITGGFLAFFEDHLTDRSPTSNPNTITSEIPAYFFEPLSSTGAVDTSKASTSAIAPRQSINPAPLLSIAGQDNQERKAVRVNNIEFVLPGTSKNFSERYYNVEFSIKTTKSDQVLTYGQWESFQYYGSRIGVIGLSDGKIYLATDDSSPIGTSLTDLRRNIPSTAPHPKNKTASNPFNYFLGRNNIADGNWHHVIIQRGWTDGRTQIWVDGKLDRQIGVLNELGGSGYASFDGSNGTDEIRPYILGFNSNDPLLYSDFTISAWNFYPGRFLEQRDISLNYAAYAKWEPIKAEPMLANVNMTNNNKAGGNRARALMLYFWPVETELGKNKSITSTDNGQFGAFDEPTFETFLTNVDRIEYQGWDLFPVDVIGTRISPMIKPEVWGGYGYRDQITGAPRYLDLVNDIDLTQFDAIFFRNFPEQTEELDEYVRQEFADTYFGIKESELYENFLKSLRAAVDSGLSLYITNAKLAIDLGIVDRVEIISDMSEGTFEPTSSYVTSQMPVDNISYTGQYYDTHKNNKFRVVNTLDGLTNEESYIWKDWMYFENTDELNFGGPNRPYASVEHRPNGLQVGDEFVNSSATIQGTQYEAVPFVNVKAGKIITAFSNTIKTGANEVANPYKDYATCIAVEPGTILNGKATGGKIFVNFTERLQGSVSQISGNVAQGRRAIYTSRDVIGVDLNQDKWINLAFAQGQITETKKNQLLTASGNLDRQLEQAIQDNDSVAIARINQLKYWDSNGINILSSRNILNDTTGSGDLSPKSPGRTTIVNKTKRSGDPGTAKVTTFGQWFTFEYSWLFLRLQVATVSMLTRGFRWLSDKIVDDGKVIRVTAMNATTASIPMPLTTADKDRSIYVPSMLANARLVHAPGYALSDASYTPLPMFADAKFTSFVKNIQANTFNANVLVKQPRIVGIQEDEIVVYINHVDPILYLMEDVIK